jgi:GNAT superfamily N-acetyltransferase
MSSGCGLLCSPVLRAVSTTLGSVRLGADPAVVIRPLLPADGEPAIRAVREGGWGDRRPELEFYVRHPPCHPFVAETDGTIVGTALATCSDRIGWLGLVFVAPAMRGRGLGAALTRTALEFMTSLGCRSVLLAASELGQPIYDRLGFVVDGAYAIWTGARSSAATTQTEARVRRLTPDDLSAVAELDRRVTGEDRGQTIGAMGEGWVLADRGRVHGYALRTPWGLGPAIAEDVTTGQALVDLLLAHASASPTTIIVPTANATAHEHLVARGFVVQRELPRMRLGDPVSWQPSRIWAIYNFALG